MGYHGQGIDDRDNYDEGMISDIATEIDYSNFRTLPLTTDLELDPIYDETADNPYRVSGTAPPGSIVNVYAYGQEFVSRGNGHGGCQWPVLGGCHFPWRRLLLLLCAAGC